MREKVSDYVNKISWNITKPFSTACIYDNDVEIKLNPKVFDEEVKIKHANEVALLFDDTQIIFTEPIKGSILKSIFRSIERGLERIIDNYDIATRRSVYKRIGGFISFSRRMKLIRKYEYGKLKIKDLLGDHVFFEGGLHHVNGIWVYDLGS